MCQDQRLLQPAGGRTLCRAASVCSSPPPSHLYLIENIIGASKCPYKSSIREHGSVSLCRDGQKTKWRLQCKY